MCNAATETSKRSLLANDLSLEAKKTLTAPNKLVGNSIALKKSSSESTLSQTGSDGKIVTVKNQLSESNIEKPLSKRFLPLKLATWVFKPFVLCAKGVKIVVLAICRATKAIFSFIFGSRYTAEVQEWKNSQLCTRSLSEGSFDALIKSKRLQFYPLLSPSKTFEDLPEVAASEIHLVNGLKYSAFALPPDATEPVPVQRSAPLPLNNIGNSCYFNSAIQVVYNSPDLCELVRRPIEKNDRNEKGFDLLESYQNAWVRILDVYDCINRCSDPVQRPRLEEALVGELWALRNWVFTGQNKKENPQIVPILESYPFHQELVLAKMCNTITAQHDPANLFEGLFDLLNLNILSKTQRRVIHQDQLHASESKPEPLSRLIHCSVTQKNASLQNLIEQQFFEKKRDPKNAYHLELPNGTSLSAPNYNVQTILIGEPPKTLALHLKRFDAKKIGKKNESEVELPANEVVDLSVAFQKPEVNYRITGCIVHGSNEKSTVHSGHYTSYVNCKQGWYHCNDYKPVRKLSWDDVRKEVATCSYIFTLEKVEHSDSAKAGA